MKKTLEFLDQLSSPIDHSADHLCHLVVTALGENELKEMMHHYSKLKHENGIFSEISKMILEVCISYPCGLLRVALDEGVYGKGDCWYAEFDAGGSSAAAVSDIGMVKVSFSGIRLEINLAQTLGIILSEVATIGAE